MTDFCRNTTPYSSSYAGAPAVGTAPSLTFTVTAWTKLLHMCHLGSTEVGGFGELDREEFKQGKFVVTDFHLVKQECSAASVQFDDDDLARYLEEKFQQPGDDELFFRVWIHTHPGMSASPSGTDENTFRAKFGEFPWAMMVIIGRSEAPHPEVYTRLRFNCGFISGVHTNLPIKIKYQSDPQLDVASWDDQYAANVAEKKWSSSTGWQGNIGGIASGRSGSTSSGGWCDAKSAFESDKTPPAGVIVPPKSLVWWDEVKSTVNLRDFDKTLFNNLQNWRDYSSFVKELQGMLVYKGPTTGQYYAFPAGAKYDWDSGDPQQKRLCLKVKGFWSSVMSKQPDRCPDDEWARELWYVREAIRSGRFNYGRTFQPIQRNLGTGTAG